MFRESLYSSVNYKVFTESVVPIPTSGENAFARNEWFHVAVTYNGNAGVANKLSFYWTRVGADPGSANLIGTVTLATDLGTLSDVHNFGIGTTTRGQFRTELYRRKKLSRGWQPGTMPYF